MPIDPQYVCVECWHVDKRTIGGGDYLTKCAQCGAPMCKKCFERDSLCSGCRNEIRYARYTKGEKR